MIESELLPIARGFGPNRPSDFNRLYDWFRDALYKVRDEDLEALYNLCVSKWRKDYVLKEWERRERRAWPPQTPPLHRTAWERLGTESY